MSKDIVDLYAERALTWPSPHVRRLTAVILEIGNAIKRAGFSIQEISGRRVAINGGAYVLHFQHASKNPRHHNAIVIKDRNGKIVFEAGAIDMHRPKVIAFCHDPRSVLRNDS